MTDDLILLGLALVGGSRQILSSARDIARQGQQRVTGAGVLAVWPQRSRSARPHKDRFSAELFPASSLQFPNSPNIVTTYNVLFFPSVSSKIKLPSTYMYI